jgi:hypothetical protein
MKRVVSAVICLLFISASALAEKRFDREVIKLEDRAQYSFVKLDDVNYPVLKKGTVQVSSLVYKGTMRYYVEISISNQGTSDIAVAPDFIAFTKPGYSVYRTDTVNAAVDVASDASIPFIPTPPSIVPPTANTTINATATSYGNQTQINGTATTTYDYSGQAGANFGNALGNAIAARRYRNQQVNEARFAHFLNAHAQPPVEVTLRPGETRIVAVTFEQSKRKSAPFQITVIIGSEQFRFSYKG